MSKPLCVHELLDGHALPVRQAAWYAKPLPTFIDALALVHRHFWPIPVMHALSPSPTETSPNTPYPVEPCGQHPRLRRLKRTTPR